jgi:hypothetical protein
MPRFRLPHLRTLFLAVLLSIIAGCLSIPLGDPEQSVIDAKLLGWWQATQTDGGKHELVLLQAYDARTYLVWDMHYAGDADNIEPDGSALVMKGWLTPIRGKRFMTLKLMNPSQELQDNKEKDRYVVMRIDESSDGLHLKAIADKFVADCATPEALKAKIAANVDNDALYDANGGGLYTAVDDAHKASLDPVIKKFGL